MVRGNPVNGDHFPGDPGHRVDFTDVQRYYSGQWYNVNAANWLFSSGPNKAAASATVGEPAFKIWDKRSW